ncbi:hypothetical protein ACIFOT_00675 [Neobacillus sp. NRS-1170]|uniref:hypothetical protein n=1 Tax=Neobacillus sp. NRS-1170 TaxID=3233898 RepID=UPI003D275F74
MRKFIISGLFAFGLFAFIIPNVQAASVQGWKSVKGNWYYYTSSTTTYKGWLFDRGHWYYLDSDGKMKRGWLQQDGKWYYLNEITGAMRTGWQKDKYQWYYFNRSGVMQTGWVKDNSKWYFMDSNGRMQTGWVYDDGHYYLDSTGAMKTGWFIERHPLGTTRGVVYAYPNGKAAYNEMVDEAYFVNDEGVWVPSENLEKYYKPLKMAAQANGARLSVLTDRGPSSESGPFIDLFVIDVDKNDIAFSFYYEPGKETDIDFTSITGKADSKYTSLYVDSAIALGCPLDKQSLTDVITQSLNQGGKFTDGSVTVTTTNQTIYIDW